MNSGKCTPEPTIETAGAKSAETKAAGEFSESLHNNTFAVVVKGKIVCGEAISRQSLAPGFDAAYYRTREYRQQTPAIVMTTGTWSLARSNYADDGFSHRQVRL